MSMNLLFNGMNFRDDLLRESDQEKLLLAEQLTDFLSAKSDTIISAKNNEISIHILDHMYCMYNCAKKYGVNRTFISLYNQNGELDKICGTRFPSCESFVSDSNNYKKYTTLFIAAMEDGKDSLWQKIKQIAKRIWEWIKNKVSRMWFSFTQLFGRKLKNLDEALKSFERQYSGAKNIRGHGIIGSIADEVGQYSFGKIKELINNYIAEYNGFASKFNDGLITALDHLKVDEDEANTSNDTQYVKENKSKYRELDNDIDHLTCEFGLGQKIQNLITNILHTYRPTGTIHLGVADGRTIISKTKQAVAYLADIKKKIDHEYTELNKTAEILNARCSKIDGSTHLSDLSSANRLVVTVSSAIQELVKNLAMVRDVLYQLSDRIAKDLEKTMLYDQEHYRLD